MIPVAHSFAHDGKIHFGNSLMILNKETGAFLVNDVWEKLEGSELSKVITASS